MAGHDGNSPGWGVWVLPPLQPPDAQPWGGLPAASGDGFLLTLVRTVGTCTSRSLPLLCPLKQIWPVSVQDFSELSVSHLDPN